MAPKSKPFYLGHAPVYKSGYGEILIRNRAVAVNPVDWKIQESGKYLNSYPFILGRDCAGIVERVGERVTRFQKGQHVIAHLHSPRSGNFVHAAYQIFSLASYRFSAALPEGVAFEGGTVLPLAISTAAAGLYLPGYLGLPLPSIRPTPLEKTVLIWGGSSSVGATAIQLAVAFGLRFIITASNTSHSLVKTLGANAVFDYSSSKVVEDVLASLNYSQLVGIYDAIGNEKSSSALASIAERVGCSVQAVAVHPREHPAEAYNPSPILTYGIAYPPNEAIGTAVWGTFVPQALKNGKLRAKPDPMVVGYGLENVQKSWRVGLQGYYYALILFLKLRCYR